MGKRKEGRTDGSRRWINSEHGWCRVELHPPCFISVDGHGTADPRRSITYYSPMVFRGLFKIVRLFIVENYELRLFISLQPTFKTFPIYNIKSPTIPAAQHNPPTFAECECATGITTTSPMVVHCCEMIIRSFS